MGSVSDLHAIDDDPEPLCGTGLDTRSYRAEVLSNRGLYRDSTQAHFVRPPPPPTGHPKDGTYWPYGKRLCGRLISPPPTVRAALVYGGANVVSDFGKKQRLYK
jgi:hypothetical protein